MGQLTQLDYPCIKHGVDIQTYHYTTIDNFVANNSVGKVHSPSTTVGCGELVSSIGGTRVEVVVGGLGACGAPTVMSLGGGRNPPGLPWIRSVGRGLPTRLHTTCDY